MKLIALASCYELPFGLTPFFSYAASFNLSIQAKGCRGNVSAPYQGEA